MRIIAGKFRGRKLNAPPFEVARPTSDRTRESIFNIINSYDRYLLDQAHVLDAFAGSGALGLEALSRGALNVTFMEKDPRVLRVLKENISLLQVSTQCTLIKGDATKPQQAPHPMNLVFLDPPYAQTLESLCLLDLQERGWISSQTLIVLETSPRALTLPTDTRIIDQRQYGAAQISFLELQKN
ncbi:MAG: 16S rRNA (guanine(966)-N(2))-methyltransferase RsmD [Alphaproteobacteria bacterium]|nr:16S rRNA (guanine(966)-N(2))-methyltransferase RsmD [Alphaproteobacteria bacterium]